MPVELLLILVPVAVMAMLAIRDLPVFGILVVLLAIRITVDGDLNLPLAGGSLTSLIGLAILALAIASGLRTWRSFTSYIAVGVVLYISAVFASDIDPRAIDEYIRTMSVLGVWVIMRSLRHLPQPLTVVRSIQGIALISAAPSIYQGAAGTGVVVDGVIRAAGTMAHPNSAALMCAIAGTLSLVSYFELGRKRRDLVALAIFVVAILASGSMGGLLAFLVMLLAYAVVSPTIGSKLRVTALFLATATALAFVFSPLGAGRLSELSGLDLTGASGERNSLEWRFGRWRQLLEYWETSPLAGNGYGSASNGALLFGYAPHSEYVRLLVEVGLLGLFAALLAAVLIVRRSYRFVSIQAPNAPVASAGIAIIIGLLVNATAENTFMYSVIGYALILILAYSTDRRFRPSSDSPPPFGTSSAIHRTGLSVYRSGL